MLPRRAVAAFLARPVAARCGERLWCRPPPSHTSALSLRAAWPYDLRWMSTQIATDAASHSDELPLPTEGSDEPAVRYATRAGAFLMFESPVYSRMVNMIMQQGKKEKARRHLWQALLRIREGGQDPQEVFYGALDNVRPMMEMKSFRSGPVPFPLNPHRSEGQAMKWIVGAARGKKGAPKRGKFDRRLANELLAAYQNKGGAIAKKEQVHKDAVANQAAAHFRWRVGSSAAQGTIDLDRRQYRPVGRRAIKRLQGSLPRAPPTTP